MNSVKSNILFRVNILFIALAVLGAAVVCRIAFLQTVKKTELSALADSLSTRYVEINPLRGNLYAEDGSLLATSIPIYEARFDTHTDALTEQYFNKNVDSLAWCLSNFFEDKSPEQYAHDLRMARKKEDRYYLIHRRLKHTEVQVIRNFPIFRLGKYKGGLITTQDYIRMFPFGQLAQRTIGYSRKDIKPVGLEGAFDTVLTGNSGMRLMQRIAGGGWVPINKDNEIEPRDGEDIITSIDVNFQDISEAALLKVLQANNAEHGCAVLMETATGKIKAIANLTRQTDNSYTEGYNYAIGASTEPGSTFKLVSVLALLDKNKATPSTKYDTRDGTMNFYDRVMRDAKDGGHGVVTLQQAFEISSNVAISTAVNEAFSSHPSVFTDYIKKLGITQRLGLPIAGEGKPVFKTPKSKDWYGTTLPWMSIGYEVRLTPLQILTLYNAVANNGVMVKPRFVTEIQDAGKSVQKFGVEVINPQICSKSTLRQVRNMMEGVVENGTAKNIRNDLFPIAGKTGTAQIADEMHGYRAQKIYQSSFVGYFPANKPKYSCIVMISGPSGGVYYGALVAAPAFREIAERVYAQTSAEQSFIASFQFNSKTPLPIVSGIRQDELSSLMSIFTSNRNLQVEPDPDYWVSPYAENNKLTVKPLIPKKKAVPDVKGMVLSDAIFRLENAGLDVKFKGYGKVTKQSLPPGEGILPDQKIYIELN
jgi:cell division protein FtsI (penicillin-binding protein 3)